jgi:hypothetical protein
MTLPTFYQGEPRSSLSLSRLEAIVIERVSVLCSLQEDEVVIIPPPDGGFDLESHLILRLAVAYLDQNKVLGWFLSSESLLFEKRLLGCPLVDNWWSKYELDYDSIVCTPTVFQPQTQTVVKVPFAEVPFLVKSRDVVLSKGFAMVPYNNMVKVVVHRFRSTLKSLVERLQHGSVFNIVNNPQMNTIIVKIAKVLHEHLKLNEVQ